MENFLWAVFSSLAVSLISLVGVLGFFLKEKLLNRILLILIGFSAGGLIGGAFLHLIPEALEKAGADFVFLIVITGFILFFILERYLYWRHCHNGVCDVHVFTYLNLIGDGIHNFVDGLIIGTSFVVDIKFGLITTLVIIFHEIPQEIGDFGVLVYGGFSRLKALFYNFLSAITCIAGTAAGFYFAANTQNFAKFLLPITAGGFIYIAACDLIPELHKQPGLVRATFSLLAFCCGIVFILLARLAHLH